MLTYGPFGRIPSLYGVVIDIRVLDSISKTHWCDILPNEHTMRFAVGTKIITPEAKGLLTPSQTIGQNFIPKCFAFYAKIYLCKYWYFLILPFCVMSKWWYLSPRTSVPTQLHLPLWWLHNIFLWSPNGTSHQACGTHNEYLIFENSSQTTMYIYPRILL